MVDGGCIPGDQIIYSARVAALYLRAVLPEVQSHGGLNDFQYPKIQAEITFAFREVAIAIQPEEFAEALGVAGQDNT